MQYLEVKNWNFEEKITPNFTVGELVRSYEAYKHKLYVQYMFRQDVYDYFHLLCGELLQPLRDEIEAPVRVTSGYRCKALNSIVGGAENSLHMLGLAADVQVYQMNDKVASILSGFRYHELIVYPTFVHVSIKENWNGQRFIDKR